MRLEDDLLGGDLRVYVWVAVGPDRVRLVDLGGEVEAKSCARGDMDEAPDAVRHRGLQHPPGPEDVDVPEQVLVAHL